ncbi:MULTISPECIES: ATP-binding protein [unclassified Nocardia]|uniref:ATP-binding protein n=1 Tax=unclassified Nocardia TaxID=2637762 RepID=UPI00278C1D73|nr:MULTISPECIES: ATP-binding protein [unclassified Nocardia]
MTQSDRRGAAAWVWSIAVGGDAPTMLPVTAQLEPAQREGLTTGITPATMDRVRAAIGNAGYRYPDGRVIVSATLPPRCRAGVADLAVAVAIMSVCGVIARLTLADTAFLGQLGLDGRLSAGVDVAEAVRTAQRAGLRRVVIPTDSTDRLSRTPGIEVFAAPTLAAVLSWAADPSRGFRPPGATRTPVPRRRGPVAIPADAEVRDAVHVCAAGGHHLAVTGAPGAPTLVPVHYLHGLLPLLSRRHALDLARLRLRTGLACVSPLPLTPPLFELHHSASWRTIVGTADHAGVAALADQGVVACVEFPHMDSRLRHALTTVTQEGVIRCGAGQQSRLPARFQLALVGHDCRCEGADDHPDASAGHVCFRWPRDDLDACVDVRVRVQPGATETGSRAQLPGRDAVIGARRAAERRWSRLGVYANARVPVDALRGAAGVNSAAVRETDRLTATGVLTAAQAGAVLAVAWTLCDLRGGAEPTMEDLERALRLRRPR